MKSSTPCSAASRGWMPWGIGEKYLGEFVWLWMDLRGVSATRVRISLGMAVVFGTLLNTLFGTLVVPNFYYFWNTLKPLKKSKK